jgi:hypothetical protein
VLDLVDPVGPSGRLEDARRDAGCNETKTGRSDEHPLNYRLALPVGSPHNAAAGGVVRVAYLAPLYPGDDVTAYIVVEDFGQFGRAFRETDLAEADLGTIVRNMFSGEYRDRRGSSPSTRSKGGQIAYDLLDRAYEVDTTLSVGAKRFIDRHVTRVRNDPGTVGRARTRSVGPQEGVKTDRLRGPVPRYWRDGRQDTRARHCRWRP